MHLGNSIICPVTGIPMIVAMGAASVWAFKKAKEDFTRNRIIPAVVLTALVFSLQMINFSIPTTSSSGHIIGAMLLSILLGPYVAFLAMGVILLVQCLLFADGGILALGCNIFNMGFLACFVVYPFVYKFFEGKNKPLIGAVLSSVIALQLGSLAVVAEGTISGSVVSIGAFAYLMQGIHLAIGLIEGVMTAIICFAAQKTNMSKIFSYIIGVVAIFIACVISQFASTKPDGLEWSLLNLSDNFVAQTQGQFYVISETIQAKTALLTNIPAIYSNFIGCFAVILLAILMFHSCCRCDNQANQA